MRESVGRGGCSAKGHYGIQTTGLIQLGEILPHLDFSFTPPNVETVRIVFLSRPSVLAWRSLGHLVGYLSRVYPSILEVVTSSAELKEEVDKKYGRPTEAGEMPEVCQ